MNPNPHQQAREWAQLQLDGHLSGENALLLEAHLRDCAGCRAYVAQFEHLDTALKNAFRERTLTWKPVLSHSSSADRAIHRHMRLKMKSTQVTKFATSLLFLVLIAVTVISFSWLISTRGRMIFPGAGGVDDPPLPTSTPTPLPWTEDHPLTSAEQIASTLDGLAGTNVEAVQGSTWVHIVSRDQSQPGMIQSFYSDSWFHYPEDERSCAESVIWVKETPESSKEFLQILVGMPDGTSGDLISLRSGEGQVTYNEPGSYACAIKPEFTYAGQLAKRLREEQAALAGKPIDVKAWYSITDGRALFVVSVTFTQPSKANYTGIMKEVQSFDLETGAIVQLGNRMEWEDGSVFGETLQGFETSFYDELPAEVAAQFEQLSGELHAYATGTAVQPTATHIPETAPVPVVEDEQFIPETAPLTDGQTILRILEALQRRQIERLSEAGWYVYGPETVDADDWMNNYYLLTHTADPSGACDFMSYYVRGEEIMPQQLVLADGRWGTVDGVNTGQVTPGKTGEIGWNNGSVSSTCQLPNTETVSYLQNETASFRHLVDGQTQGTYKAWTQGGGGRRFFVLYYELAGDGLGVVMDPDTRKLEPIDHSQTWVYFDLDWGTVLGEAGEQVFFLQNGKTVGEPPSPDKTIDVGYLYYRELPANLEEVYEKTIADLEAELQK